MSGDIFECNNLEEVILESSGCRLGMLLNIHSQDSPLLPRINLALNVMNAKVKNPGPSE